MQLSCGREAGQDAGWGDASGGRWRRKPRSGGCEQWPWLRRGWACVEAAGTGRWPHLDGLRSAISLQVNPRWIEARQTIPSSDTQYNLLLTFKKLELATVPLFLNAPRAIALRT